VPCELNGRDEEFRGDSDEHFKLKECSDGANNDDKGVDAISPSIVQGKDVMLAANQQFPLQPSM